MDVLTNRLTSCYDHTAPVSHKEVPLCRRSSRERAWYACYAWNPSRSSHTRPHSASTAIARRAITDGSRKSYRKQRSPMAGKSLILEALRCTVRVADVWERRSVGLQNTRRLRLRSPNYKGLTALSQFVQSRTVARVVDRSVNVWARAFHARLPPPGVWRWRIIDQPQWGIVLSDRVGRRWPPASADESTLTAGG